MTLENTQVPYREQAASPIRPSVRPLSLTAAIFVGLVMLLMFAFVLSLAVGSVNIPVGQIATVLTGGTAENAAHANIVYKFRLPKALTAVMAGASLGVSGLLMQTMFRNPIAGPYVLGVSAGASLGVALVVLSVGTAGGTLLAGLGWTGDVALAGSAALGAGVTLGVVLLAARHVRSSTTLLILGLMFGYVTNAVVSMLLHFAVAERIQAYVNWTFGSFSAVTLTQLSIVGPVVAAGLLLAFALSKSLNALLLGERYARSLGVPLHRLRAGIVVSTALLAGVVTAFCGPIGFIGIAVPHLCRILLRTSDHRLLLPACVLVGGTVALVAAIIAEVPGSSVILPLNAVLAALGAPVVIWIVLGQRSLRDSFAT